MAREEQVVMLVFAIFTSLEIAVVNLLWEKYKYFFVNLSELALAFAQNLLQVGNNRGKGSFLPNNYSQVNGRT